VRSLGMEKNQIDGFILEASAPSNVAAGAGVTHARFIAVAESTDDAIWLVGKLGFPGAKVIDRGPSFLTEAREMGVPDNSARPYQNFQVPL
jgi:hypothetical protein